MTPSIPIEYSVRKNYQGVIMNSKSGGQRPNNKHDKDKPFYKVIEDVYKEGMQNHNKQCGYYVVKTISAFLPHADSIGLKILNANHNFITFVIKLDEKIVPHKIKSKLILLSIKMAQSGDQCGSHLMQMYYDLVENFFKD
jgi:hypothetical protein